MATWKKVVVSGSSAELAGLTVDATITGAITGDAGGNAATATKIASITNSNIVQLASSQALTNKDLSGAGNTFPTFNQDTSGNAATATALETARSIGGVSFNGTADINLPGVNAAGSQDTSGTAATATALETARNLQVSLSSTSAASFDGSGNATSIGVSGTLGTAQGGLGFAPTISAGNAGKVIKVKSDGSGFELADDDASSVTPTSTTTFTNKSIDLTDNTLSGTLAEFNTAVSDATLVSLAGTETLTNKTLTSPAISNPTGLDKADVGLGNVDNTADSAKPISTAQQTALNAKQDTITGAATTIAGSDLTVSRALASNASGKVAVATTTLAELNYVNGVTSAIQTQIDAKQATIDASNRLSATLIGANGDVSNAEYGFLNGVTSAIQTQLDSKIGAADTALTGTTTAEALTVSGNVVLGDALTDQVTVNGDLTVKGTASFESTENLLVKDRFITLASGSTDANGDGGIVVETSTSNGGQGPAFAWNGGDSRWGVAQTVQSDAASYAADAFMAAVLKPAGANTASTILAIDSNYNKKGNLYVSSGAEDIWIYS